MSDPVPMAAATETVSTVASSESTAPARWLLARVSGALRHALELSTAESLDVVAFAPPAAVPSEVRAQGYGAERRCWIDGFMSRLGKAQAENPNAGLKVSLPANARVDVTLDALKRG